MSTTKKKDERFRLRNMNITRVDLVDRGANQDAHIVLAKADTETKPKPESEAKPKVGSDLASRIREMMSGSQPAPEPGKSPLGRPRGEQQRIARIKPQDFEVTEMSQNMMEWAIPEDKLPEGVEEAIMTMMQSGEEVMFQWMIDPLAGPPVEGQAKSAAEAYAQMRAALTNQGAMDPMAMLGGLPGEMAPGGAGRKPGKSGMGGQPQQQQKKPNGFAKSTPGRRRALKALAAAKRQNKKRMAEGKKPIVDGKEVSPASLSKVQARETLDNTLDLIVKGLVEVDVFDETATGRDLRDILPRNLLVEITNQLSATPRAPSNPGG